MKLFPWKPLTTNIFILITSILITFQHINDLGCHVFFSWLGLSNCKFPTKKRQINVHKTQKNANLVYWVGRPHLK